MIKLQHNKFNTLSDLHIKHDASEEAKFFERFVNESIDQNVDALFLLGDIFDLLIGSDSKMIDEYPRVFSSLKKALNKNIKVYFVEGNHDFHLDIFFKKKFTDYYNKNLFYCTNAVMNVCGEDKILLCHGDDIEIDNLTYQLYRLFIRSNWIKFIANHLLNNNIINYIGKNASRKSRRYSQNYNVDQVKLKFRKSAEIQIQNGYNVIICGHSHVLDEYQNINGLKYYNNGYAPHYRKYIHYNEGIINFIEIN
jgi:UDP-2,3-diacylglucosamine hydrolase